MSTASTNPSQSIGTPAVQEPYAAGAPHHRWWTSTIRSLPNLIVFGVLGGVLYIGHHTGWKMAKFSVLLGAASENEADWCSEHLVPESQCIECNIALMPKHKEFGFCRNHGVAECVICHPELAQVTGEPKLPSYNTIRPLGLMTRSENNSRNMLHKRRVQFASSESATKSGIDVDVVQERPMTDGITANGEVEFDPSRVAHLSSRVAGTVAYVLKMAGSDVRAGDILVLVDAAAVGQAKAQLLHAFVKRQLCETTAGRLRNAGAVGAVSGKSILDAESALQDAEIGFISARQTLVNMGFEVPERFQGEDAKQIAEDLQFLGVPQPLVASLPAGTKTTNLIPIRAPYDGTVVASDVVAGEVVNMAKVLFTIADPKQMRLLLNVRQEDARYVVAGLPVIFRTDDYSQEVRGRISWVSPTIDERTRTLQVRINLDNQQGRLRDKTFGTGRIVLREEPNAVVVPREAVQSTSDANFVFVRDRYYLKDGAPKLFHVRQVRVGAKDDHYVELLAGVLPGEVVATKGSPVLLAQLLRSNLGAGCGCHER
jgi:membrane fusion protein, heavy metal efflux system